jgi:hypothetical protein
MSRLGDDTPEIEMQYPVVHDPAEGSSSTIEKPEGDSSVNGETPTGSTPKETPRKANQFRGRQIQMMAISISRSVFENVANIEVSQLVRVYFTTLGEFFTLMGLSPSSWDIYLSGPSCTR